MHSRDEIFNSRQEYFNIWKLQSNSNEIINELSNHIIKYRSNLRTSN